MVFSERDVMLAHSRTIRRSFVGSTAGTGRSLEKLLAVAA
jgi:hypothetical protein